MNKLLILSLCLMAGPAWGEVYKCRDGDGNTVYGDTPCGQAVPLPEVAKKAKPAQGLRPEEKQRLRKVEAREATERKDNKQRRSEEKAAQRRAEQDAKSCRSAKRRITGADFRQRKQPGRRSPQRTQNSRSWSWSRSQ